MLLMSDYKVCHRGNIKENHSMSASRDSQYFRERQVKITVRHKLARFDMKECGCRVLKSTQRAWDTELGNSHAMRPNECITQHYRSPGLISEPSYVSPKRPRHGSIMSIVLGYLPKKQKVHKHKDLHTNAHSGFICCSLKLGWDNVCMPKYTLKEECLWKFPLERLGIKMIQL